MLEKKPSLGPSDIQGGHGKGELVATHHGIFFGTNTFKCTRREPVLDRLLHHFVIITRQQNDPIGGTICPSDLLLSRGRARSGRVSYQ